MKNKITLLSIALMIISVAASAQTVMKEVVAGHTYKISLPDYMSKTTGLNNSASIQFKNAIKDVYGFVIHDTKEDLKLVEMNFASINEFYENFIKDFATDTEERKVSTPKSQKKGETNFIESDLTYYDKESKVSIYYLIGIVETKKAFYKVLSWSTTDNKDKFKADFQKILYSLTD